MIDELILVDNVDDEIGFKEKEECHLGDGNLHRAFSIFIFNDKKELLIQQRGKHKMLWPLFWSNSCCSHPRKGENLKDATIRRIMEECGITCDLKEIYKFKYSAKFENKGSENEICHVFIGESNDKVIVDPEEIEDYKWVKIEDLLEDISEHPKKYTPWFKMEIVELKRRNLL